MRQSGDLAERLFAPCERYGPDPDLPVPDRPSCVYCVWQYAPGKVCPVFQERLLGERGDQ